MDKYAVFGNPIKHSKSPAIHQEFARQASEKIEYTAILAPLDGFEQSIREFVASGGKGANVTVPFKEQAFELVDQLSLRAKKAGAVNTIMVNSEGLLLGDNTDGIGLVNDILNNGVTLKGKRILLIGAGGAARGVLQPLLEQNPAQVSIINRTKQKADTLKNEYHLANAYGFDDAPRNQYDIVINSTSASITGDIPSIHTDFITHCELAYDMFYSKTITAFNQWVNSINQDAKLLDGIGMLVGQAAEAYYIWRDFKPETKEVISKLANGELA
jgi:shikimate dehydrogenase